MSPGVATATGTLVTDSNFLMFQNFKKFPFRDISSGERGKENTLSVKTGVTWMNFGGLPVAGDGQREVPTSGPDDGCPSDHIWVAPAELLGRSAKDLDFTHAVYCICICNADQDMSKYQDQPDTMVTFANVRVTSKPRCAIIHFIGVHLRSVPSPGRTEIKEKRCHRLTEKTTRTQASVASSRSRRNSREMRNEGTRERSEGKMRGELKELRNSIPSPPQ